MAYDLYQVLELTQDATEKEIKAAFFRLVRKYTPEDHPEKFKEIRKAYETLRDPKVRANYDAMEQSGEAIEQLVVEAREHEEKKNWEEAVRCYKRIVALAPGLDWAWNALGLCYSYQEDYPNADKIFTRLTARAGDVAVYWYNYGWINMDLFNKSEHSGYLSLARKMFEKAHELEPFNSTYPLDIARTYLDSKDYSQALTYVNKAIAINQETNFQDMDAYLVKSMIYIGQGQPERVVSIADEVLAAPGGDLEFYKYAAYRLAAYGYEFYKSRRYAFAKVYAEAALKLNSESKEIRILFEDSELFTNCEREWKLIEKDSSIADPVKKVALFNLAGLFGEVEDYQTAWVNVCTHFPGTRGSQIIESVSELEQKYPWTYKLQPKTFDTAKEFGFILRDYDLVDGDSLIARPLKWACHLFTYRYFGIDYPNYDRDFNMMVRSLDDYSPREINASVERIKNRYKRVYELGQQFFEELLRVSSSYLHSGSRTTAAAASTGGSGCAIPIIIAVFILLGFIFG